MELIETYMNYSDAATVLGDVMNASLYSLINPPKLINQNNRAFLRYKNYILNLQKEILSLIEFCHDIDFYPKLLSKFSPAGRFSIYSKVNESQFAFERKEIYRIEGFFRNTALPSTEQASFEPMLMNSLDTESIKKFAKEFDTDEDIVKFLMAFPNFSTIYYECSTIYDMLMLEFTKMFEHKIRFKKCKNCGKYFILKGNYQTDFCDRIHADTQKSCQKIGALKNYKEKVKDSDAWSLYNKYYKRYFARKKLGNIDADVFKKWQY